MKDKVLKLVKSHAGYQFGRFVVLPGCKSIGKTDCN